MTCLCTHLEQIPHTVRRSDPPADSPQMKEQAPVAVVVRNLDHGHWLVAWQENLGAYSFHWSKMLLHLPDDCQCLRKGAHSCCDCGWHCLTKHPMGAVASCVAARSAGRACAHGSSGGRICPQCHPWCTQYAQCHCTEYMWYRCGKVITLGVEMARVLGIYIA